MTEPEALYVHLLFALKDRNLGTLEANFAQLVYSGLYALEAQWKLLVDDIELGRVNPDLEINGDVRRSVMIENFLMAACFSLAPVISLHL